MRLSVMFMVILTLAGCEALPDWASGNRSEPVIDAPADPDPTPTVPDVPDAETLEPDASAEQDVSIGTLGRTVASLGNAAEPGLWLKTPLVSVEQAGRVYYPETNTTVDVTLIPIEGPKTAGSRLSLGAMQALGAPLTGLPEVDVFGA